MLYDYSYSLVFIDEEANTMKEKNFPSLSSIMPLGTKYNNLPLFIRGITDGDVTFTVLVYKSNNSKVERLSYNCLFMLAIILQI